jgi:ribose-phosphate pyrophosphokinase
MQKLNNSPVTNLVATDSIPLANGLQKVHIESVAHLFAEAIRRNFHNESISSLFDVDKG